MTPRGDTPSPTPCTRWMTSTGPSQSSSTEYWLWQDPAILGIAWSQASHRNCQRLIASESSNSRNCLTGPRVGVRMGRFRGNPPLLAGDKGHTGLRPSSAAVLLYRQDSSSGGSSSGDDKLLPYSGGDQRARNRFGKLYGPRQSFGCSERPSIMQSATQAGGIIPRCPDDKSGSSVPTVLSSPQGELKTVGAIEGLPSLLAKHCHPGSTPFGEFSFGSFSGCFSSHFTSSRYVSVTVQVHALGRNIQGFLDLLLVSFRGWH